MSDIVGTTISGRYRIERLLGEGGMGAVYQAEHTLMHKRVAVKVLHAEMSKMTEVVARFEREAMAAGRIEHPNVASATDFGKLDDGSFFLVLEFIEGLSLRETIAALTANKARLTITRAIHITRQIALALARAHTLNIVHRDLKPENVMLVTRDADPDFVKVLDFGIAKVPVGELAPASVAPGDKVLTQLGMIYGTPEYMPPEQALGEEVDRRADLYALGVMLYEMLAGARPFDDESKVKLLGKHISAPVPPLASDLEIAPELEALVMRLLAKDMNERVQEAREVIEALDALVTPPPGFVTTAPQSPIISNPANSGALPVIDAVRSGANPTVLALRARAQALGTDVTRLFPPKIFWPAVAFLGLLATVTVIAIAVHAGSGAVATASAENALDAEIGAATKFEGEVKKAENDFALGQYDVVITAARAMAVEAPERPEPQHLMFRAHVAKGDVKAAIGDAAVWLGADSNAQNDPELATMLKTAVASHDDEGAAFALLESGRVGARGADMLYDMAYGSQPAAVQTRARHALAHPEVIKSASPALQVTLELREAKSCDAKRQLLGAAGDHGDARTLAILETYTGKSGCGFLGTRDCMPCLHKDDTLSKTIQTLRGRN